jgi:hypothetical protein
LIGDVPLFGGVISEVGAGVSALVSFLSPWLDEVGASKTVTAPATNNRRKNAKKTRALTNPAAKLLGIALSSCDFCWCGRYDSARMASTNAL